MLLARAKLSREPLSAVTQRIFHAGREGRTWVDDSAFGIPFLSSSSILRADLSHLPFLAKKQAEGNPDFLVKQRWTLISRSGTVGRMAYVRPDMDGMACSEHAMRVVPNDSKIPPGYLYAFLSSKFGIPMVTSGTYGAIIQHIEPEHIADLPVPRLGIEMERQVAKLVDQASQLLQFYQSEISVATGLFFESVGLKDISSAEWHASGRDLGFEEQFPRADTFRALNFNPRYKHLCGQIMRCEWLPLGQVCMPGTLHRGGRYKRIDASEEYAYRLVGQKHLFWLEPAGRWIARSALGEGVLVEPGTVLIAAQGTLGESELFCRAEFAWGRGLENAYSEHILRAVANEAVMRRGCLFAFLRSESAFRMLRSISAGTKLQDHHYALRPQLPVPIPARQDQEIINAKVIEAYEARHSALGLLQRAATIVEESIEAAA